VFGNLIKINAHDCNFGQSAKNFLIIKIRKPAEGVVSAPFLPSGDQGHKGGFAPLPKQHPITCRITNEIPHKDKPFPRSIGRKTWREHGHSQELATWSNQAKQTILAGISRVV
jgi:hypothetical protein